MREKNRCKIRRTWKPSSIYNRSVERKFAEIFDLILDRLLIYYEWNILLNELKTIFDIFEVRKFFFFFSLNDQKNLWSLEMASIKIEQFWIRNDGSHYVYSSCKENFILQLFLKCNDSEKNYEILVIIKYGVDKIYKIFKNQNDSKFFPSICTKIIYYLAKDIGIFLYYSNIFQYSYKIIIEKSI